MPPREEGSDKEMPEEQDFERWTQELTRQANEHYLKYCEASVVATTVLLGFIFDSVRNPGPSGAVAGCVPRWLTALGWCSALLSLGCGLFYILRSADTLFRYAKKSDGIRQSMSGGRYGQADRDYDRLFSPTDGGEKGDSVPGPFRRDHGWLVAQTWALFIGILLMSLSLFFR